MSEKIISKYIDYIKLEKNLSQNTVLSYNLDLKKYLDFLETNNIELLEVNENDIYTYLIYLEKKKYVFINCIKTYIIDKIFT